MTGFQSEMTSYLNDNMSRLNDRQQKTIEGFLLLSVVLPVVASMRRTNQPTKCFTASNVRCFISTSAAMMTSVFPTIDATVVRFFNHHHHNIGGRSLLKRNTGSNYNILYCTGVFERRYPYERRSHAIFSPANNMRILHTTTQCYMSKDSTDDSATTKHQLYMQQIQELENERQSLFGSTTNGDVTSSTAGIPRLPEVSSTIHDNPIATNSATNDEEDLKLDREALYGFTTEERTAWSVIGSSNSSINHANMLRDIEVARQQQRQREEDEKMGKGNHDVAFDTDRSSTLQLATDASNATASSSSTSSFSHLTENQRNIRMVDVGSKGATRRTATAQSHVIFPPEVLIALNRTDHSLSSSDINNSTSMKRTEEWMGPKGPIFATAILAGIMGVKQTSTLIPLCHPLPIENINIDIHWYNSNTIQIQCTCSVTHKTGVEMEALMGCSIAALTIYDMVKAISHNVQITNTQLIYKDGGKRQVDER